MGGANPGVKVGHDHARAEQARIPCGDYLDAGKIRLVEVLTGIDVGGCPGSANAEGKQCTNDFFG